MIDLELTFVRLKCTKEPVAIFEKVNCMAKLAFLIDEIATPSDCEYCDQPMKIELSILFSFGMGRFWRQDNSAIAESASFGFNFLSEIEDVYTDEDIEWCEIPAFVDSISTMNDGAEKLLNGDIF